MSEFVIENISTDSGSIQAEGGNLCCSWEDSHLLDSYDFSSIQHWIISSAKLCAGEIQGYHLLKDWLASAKYGLLSEQLFQDFKAIKSNHHRYLENANLIADELISNALKGDGNKASAPWPAEIATLALPQGILISVKDYLGTLKQVSFLPALQSGLKNPQIEDRLRGAGLGLCLVLRYSSAILVESIPGESTCISVFIPARSNGTKIFYFRQIE